MLNIQTCTDLSKLPPLLQRNEQEAVNVDQAVANILADVQANGDEALLCYTEKFDGVRPKSLRVTAKQRQRAKETVDPKFLKILNDAAKNIYAYHEKQRREGFIMADQPGVVLGQRFTPLERVGIYVPGGTARYPSTVLMDAIPAKIAGVRELIMVSPPGPDGEIPTDILAAADVAGVDTIFCVGGAQAVAALAYGTESIPKVDKIVGPGNIYVATAKRMVYGICSIDMIAGPSDILVLADETANPAFVAADMLSQAEHDPLAVAILVTTSEELAKAVNVELEKQLATLQRQEIARSSLEKSGRIFVTDSLEKAAEISNIVAPEHLEICLDEPFALLPLIRNAGSIFLGKYVPEALGDYFAGPNHTLPTEGTARFSSGLGVDDFVKRSSFIYYDQKALEQVAEKVATFAEHEGLDAHARSVRIRLEDRKGESEK